MPASPASAHDRAAPPPDPMRRATPTPLASHRAADPRTVLPELIKDPSALESLASTLRTWSPFESPAPAATTTPPVAQADKVRYSGKEAVRVEGAGMHALMQGEEVDSEKESQVGVRPGARTTTDAPRPELGERIAWARWDTLPAQTGDSEGDRRVLILGYTSGGLAVWDCSSLDCWSEVLNLPTLDCAFDAKVTKQLRHGIERVVGAVVVPSSSSSSDSLAADRPFLAVLARSASSSTSQQSSNVFLYSLRTHRIISTIPVPGTAHRILANRRFLVVSTTAPPALHVYQLTASSSAYTPAPFSPITDVLPCTSPSADPAPVFDLGTGGRLLAYTSSSVPSSTISRAPARPGTGILAHRGQFDAELPFAPDGVAPGFSVHDAEEMARRVGEGVRSGVAALRERGGNWLRGGEQETANAAGGADPKSAPPLVAGLTAPAAARPGPGETSPAAGTVKVVDLVASGAAPVPVKGKGKGRTPAGPTMKVIAHFRAYAQSLALLSFSPASTMLLAAPASGHSFDVFELKPSVPVGVSATSSATTASPAGEGKVWHRYRLQRGYTSAFASSASWSADGRLVAVSTAKGTAHLYALQPGGGTPRLEAHFAPRVSNADELAPLSVALGSVARVRNPPSSSSTTVATPHALPPVAAPVAVAFLPKRASATSALRPARPAHSQEALLFRPTSGTATLHRLTACAVPPATTPAGAAELARAGEVGRLASTAVSGLSQLMRSRGGLAGAGAGAPKGEKGEKRDWSVKCVGMAEWGVGREEGAGEVREEVLGDVGGAGGQDGQKVGKGVRYSAFAEIETCSRSPLVLPRSIYQSQQFEFYALPPDHARHAAKGVSAPPLRRLEMRSEVQIRQGNGTTSSDWGPSSSPQSARHLGGGSPGGAFEPASFDQPIKTAMHALLDFDQVAPGSPKLPAPTFPNGVPGKHGSWRDSIPIPRNVGPAAAESLSRVRQGLGRVGAKVPSGMLPVSVGRRRSSATAPATTGMCAAAAYSSSISFDDEDAVFADHLEGLTSASMSASTACTSELGDASGGGKGVAHSAGGDDADAEDWGWGDRVDEDEHQRAGLGAHRSGSSGALAPLSETTPFEEDYVDFELELPAASPSVAQRAAAATLVVPSPLALEPVDAVPQPAKHPSSTGSAERHLAPPVSVFATSLDDSHSPSTSPGSTSGFDASAPSSVPSPSHLLDRPGSALSGIGILAPTPNAHALAVPTNGAARSGSGSGETTSGSPSGSSSARKKKRR